MNVKSLDRIGEKWSRVTQAATQDYQQGIDNPRTDWATAAKAAEKNFAAGIQAAISRGAFGKGVTKAGTAKWQQNARDKGAPRFSQGVSVARSTYEEGFAPYRAVLAALNLPPRGPKGDPANIQRVSAVTTALRAEKMKRLGA